MKHLCPFFLSLECRLLRPTHPPTPCLLQFEVEDAYWGSGWLNTAYFKQYWMGLTAVGTAAPWTTFRWMDRVTPGPNGITNYAHWGRSLDTNQVGGWRWGCCSFRHWPGGAKVQERGQLAGGTACVA